MATRRKKVTQPAHPALVRLCTACVMQYYPYPQKLILYKYPPFTACRCEKCGDIRCADYWVKPEAEK